MLAASDRREVQKIWYAAKNSIGWTLAAPPGRERDRQPRGRREHRLDDSSTALNSDQCQPLQPGGCKVSDRDRTDPPRTRVFFTGDCDGFADLRESLAEHPATRVVGSSDHVAQAAGALAGGHLDCVLHATRAAVVPGGRDRGDPRAHARTGDRRRLERGDGAARGGARRRRRRRPAAAAARRERRLHDPQGGACEAGDARR